VGHDPHGVRLGPQSPAGEVDVVDPVAADLAVGWCPGIATSVWLGK
jgi:hypothetical protein